MSEPVKLDKRRIRRQFGRAAARYDQVAALSQEIVARMLERLDLVRLAPQTILDAGSGTGLLTRAVARRYPAARIVALDLSVPMLERFETGAAWRGKLRRLLRADRVQPLCGDFDALPLRAASFDLVISNLALHWSADLPQAFAEFQRVLRPGGLLMFSTLGPDTLQELRRAQSAQTRPEQQRRFIDMHDVGDMLVHAGFSDPVMDMEYLTLTYLSVQDLLTELRATGGLSGRAGERGLLTPRWRGRLEARYEALRANGRLPATFEIVYGHAWKLDRPARTTSDGHAIVQWDRAGKS
ncbi:MAG: malonyl-ACP O-methyltransferase BioC [Betaproteobacteria bacterium]